MTSKIKAFDKKTLPALRDAIDAALKSVGEQFGCKLYAGNCTFNPPLNATFQLKCEIDDQQTREDQEKKDFALYCGAFGLGPEHFHANIKTKLGDGFLIGFELRRSKFPFRVRLSDGREVFLTEAIIPRVKASVLSSVKA